MQQVIELISLIEPPGSATMTVDDVLHECVTVRICRVGPSPPLSPAN